MNTAEIISIGDELLIGQTVNTNASWLGQEFAKIGLKVKHVTTISDDELEIKSAIDTAFSRNDIVVMTGGLGPTKDDITKQVLADYFNSKLVINEEVLRAVTDFFEKRNRPILEVNQLQAAVPEICTVLPNNNGTAPGMWFEKEGKVLISMAGVPYEMKAIFTDYALPKIKEKFSVQSLFQKTVLIQGIGESFLADQMQDWENRLRKDGLELAYLPSPGMVKLRLTSFNGESDRYLIKDYIDELVQTLPKNVFGFENETLSGVVGALLKQRNLTIGTVESCTGGAIASAFTAIPGASDYYLGSLLTYTEELKCNLADVSSEIIEKYGVVSSEVVLQMAEGGKRRLGVDWCISVSGVAGPTGGSEQCPVGTIWIGIAGPNRTISKCFNFGDNRERNIQMSVLSALNYLRCELLGMIK
jgi:nicotinamide-nucleotide amidase